MEVVDCVLDGTSLDLSLQNCDGPHGNVGPWKTMISKAPVGQWTLRLPENTRMRELFDGKWHNYSADILLVITFPAAHQIGRTIGVRRVRGA